MGARPCVGCLDAVVDTIESALADALSRATGAGDRAVVAQLARSTRWGTVEYLQRLIFIFAKSLYATYPKQTRELGESHCRASVRNCPERGVRAPVNDVGSRGHDGGLVRDIGNGAGGPGTRRKIANQTVVLRKNSR